jgi:hypothetical protein
VLLRCVNNEDAQKLLQEAHSSSSYVIHVGGHFSAKTVAFKIISKGYYWPSIFLDKLDQLATDQLSKFDFGPKFMYEIL